ncbi:Acetyl-coenzyme A synthetase [Methylophilaceae bacterium]|nr:Acetyl-coenzyme A synthetase [Methylophilaceae bacterium]
MPMLTPIHALLSKGPDHDQYVCHDGNGFVQWHDFYAQISHLAAHLKNRQELRWLLTNPDPLGFLVELLALLHAGKQAVIPPNTQPGMLARLAEAYDAKVADIGTHVALSTTLPVFDPHDAIIHLYTSGSTGEPKLIRKSLAQLEMEINALETLWGQRLGNAAIIATVPHQHIYGLIFRLLWPLSAERIFDSTTCTMPDSLRQRLTLLGNAALISSPAQLARLPELESLTALKPRPIIIFSSGGPLPANAAKAFYQALGEAPTEVFGSTETGGIAWRRQDRDDLWTTLPGIAVDCDEDNALLLKSPFLDDISPLRMEDAIELRPDNRFRLLGRLDRIVKIEEKRLSLPDMESRLLAHPWVSNASIIALQGQRRSIGAAIVLNASGQEALETRGRREISQQLRKHLASNFEAVLLPRYWRFPAELPTDGRGKLTHAAMAALFAVKEDSHVIA